MVRDQAIDDDTASTGQVEAVRFVYSGEYANTGGRDRG
jgi:hypothetical protein